MRTFAADLGIVPVLTLKHLRDMNDLCVFRCQAEGSMYRVICVSCPTSPWGYYYFAYKGRKKLNKSPFATIYAAAEYCCRQAIDEQDESAKEVEV